MNIESIPRTFWHSISICLLIVTCGLTYVAYKSENFTLQYNELQLFANSNDALKAQLNQQADNIAQQVQTLNEKEVELERLRLLAETRLKDLEEAQKKVEELKSRLRSSKNVGALHGESAKKFEVLSPAAPATPTAPAVTDKNVKSEIMESRAKLEALNVIQEQQQIQQQQQQLQIIQQQEIQQKIQQQIQQRY